MGAARGKPLSKGFGEAASSATQGSPNFFPAVGRPAPGEQDRYAAQKTKLEKRLTRVDKREENVGRRLAETQDIIGGYQKARGFSATEELAPGATPARPAGLREMEYSQRVSQMQNSLGRLEKRKGKLQSRLDKTNEFLKNYQTSDSPAAQ